MIVSKAGRRFASNRFVWALTLIIAVSAGYGADHALARFWTDPATGFAVGGYDPVSYFTPGGPRRGSADYEATWRGQA